MTDVRHSADPAPIGVFDSGVGGLSVLSELRRVLPAERFLYLADQAHVPYAPRPADEVRGFASGVVRFLKARGAKLIVVACNTASVAALPWLRRDFPETPFVGMDPAIKPAAAATRSGRIGILATAGTFRSERYAHLVREFAQGIEVVECPCPGLVELVEEDRVRTPEAAALLRSFIGPMVNRGADTLVLGCTHFPLAREAIQEAAGPTVRLIDPAPAVARHAERTLRQHGILAPEQDPKAPRGVPPLQLFSTGPSETLAALARRVLGHGLEPVRMVRWQSTGELRQEEDSARH